MRALHDLVTDLSAAAASDARFELPAALAGELRAELRRLLGAAAFRGRGSGRARRSARASTKRVQALGSEAAALVNVCAFAEELGIPISETQLSDLRLGERTRRIFFEAGLTHVQDVANLSAERAAEIPHLAPASLAELRAAIFIALEAAGERPAPALPPPGHPEDLFEGLVAGVNHLPPRERDVLVLRAGVEDRVHSTEEVARTFGWAPEDVDRVEEHALNALMAQPACLEASWRIEELCARLGLAWDDDRLPTAVAAWYPNARASFAGLAARLMVERGRVVAEVGGRPYSPPAGVPHLEPLYQDERHMRALHGLVGALQTLGSARISALTAEVNKRLPRAHHVSNQFVRLWLTRHPELFTQYEDDRFKLASLDVDVLLGLANSWQSSGSTGSMPPATNAAAPREKRNERIAADIEAFLRSHGPQPIARIRSHLYGRFMHASADAIVAKDSQRFVRLANGLIGLRDTQ